MGHKFSQNFRDTLQNKVMPIAGSISKGVAGTVIPGMAGYSMGGPIGAATAALPGLIAGGSNLVSTIRGVMRGEVKDKPSISDIMGHVLDTGSSIVNNSSKVQSALGDSGTKMLNEMNSNLKSGQSIGTAAMGAGKQHGRAFAENISKTIAGKGGKHKENLMRAHNWTFALGKTNALKNPVHDAINTLTNTQALNGVPDEVNLGSAPNPEYKTKNMPMIKSVSD